jgi:hypothetical protein
VKLGGWNLRTWNMLFVLFVDTTTIMVGTLCFVGKQKGLLTKMLNVAIDLGNPNECVKVVGNQVSLHYLESGVASMILTLTVADGMRLRDWLNSNLPAQTTCFAVIEEERQNMGLTVSQYCRRFCFQNCSNCEDYGCGDNTNTRN